MWSSLSRARRWERGERRRGGGAGGSAKRGERGFGKKEKWAMAGMRRKMLGVGWDWVGGGWGRRERRALEMEKREDGMNGREGKWICGDTWLRPHQNSGCRANSALSLSLCLSLSLALSLFLSLSLSFTLQTSQTSSNQMLDWRKEPVCFQEADFL